MSETRIMAVLFVIFIVSISAIVVFSKVDVENDMSIAKCESLGGFADNDGWGNYTCYINGEVVK